jgi:MYXO-CTERM domain-containing protein
MNARKPYRAALVVGALVASAAAGGPAEAAQVTIFVNYAGDDFCVLCGTQNYASSVAAGWAGGARTFADPVPAGAVVTQVSANLQGSCNSTGTLDINGTLVGQSAFVSTACQCGACFDGTIATSASHPAGFPGWSYGGTNTLQITPAGTMIVDGVDVTIVYRVCGDGVADVGEACDTSGDTVTCDADCTPVVCGDGRTNTVAGEACDTSGASATCDADCSLVECGDGVVNGAAGEACDVTVENAACDGDCTLAECGDGHPNPSAGEACDDGNDAAGDGCSPACQIEDPTTAASAGGGAGDGGAGGAGDGGASSGPATSGGGDGGTASAGPTAGSGPTGPTANAANGAGPGGGENADDDGSDDGAGDGGSSGPAAGGSGSESGCGCEVPAPGHRWGGGMLAAAAVIAVATLRRRARKSRGPLGSAA